MPATWTMDAPAPDHATTASNWERWLRGELPAEQPSTISQAAPVARETVRAAARAGRRGWKRAAAGARSYGLTVVGLGAAVAAGFTAGLTTGLIVTAVAAFVAEWRVNG